MLLKSEDLEAESVAKREEEEVLWLGVGGGGGGANRQDYSLLSPAAAS